VNSVEIEYDIAVISPSEMWEPVVRRSLRHTRFHDIPALEQDMDRRIRQYLDAEYADLRGEYTPCGFGVRSTEYDRLAFLLVLRQAQECEACKAGARNPRFCSSSGKIWEVFPKERNLYVWYRPGLCVDWLRAQPQKEQAQKEPSARGYGFGR